VKKQLEAPLRIDKSFIFEGESEGVDLRNGAVLRDPASEGEMKPQVRAKQLPPSKSSEEKIQQAGETGSGLSVAHGAIALNCRVADRHKTSRSPLAAEAN
jgi:hypothetical protein